MREVGPGVSGHVSAAVEGMRDVAENVRASVLECSESFSETLREAPREIARVMTIVQESITNTNSGERIEGAARNVQRSAQPPVSSRAVQILMRLFDDGIHPSNQ